MYRVRECQGYSMWKSITVLIISFAILGVISTAQVSFGKMVSKEPHISNIVSDSFSQISRSNETGSDVVR
jgi:hypothetical protein